MLIVFPQDMPGMLFLSFLFPFELSLLNQYIVGAGLPGDMFNNSNLLP